MAQLHLLPVGLHLSKWSLPFQRASCPKGLASALAPVGRLSRRLHHHIQRGRVHIDSLP